MAICYELAENMTLAPNDGGAKADAGGQTSGKKPSGHAPVVEVLTPDEYDAINDLSEEAREALQVLASAPSNFVESYQDFIVGSFAVPDTAHPTDDPDLFSFYLDPTHLIFVDGGTTCENILASIASSKAMRIMTTPHCLYVFMKRLIVRDAEYLDKMEDAMESIEESIVDSNDYGGANSIMQYRRQSMRIAAYYTQLASMADLLADNENTAMSRSDARQFDHVRYFADRFASRADSLKEYSLQLHELHQTRIDLTQNAIMQTFTIVTVLFAPLTLITSWYGMNLTVLPGVDWPFMFLALIAVAAVCTTLLLWWFHRRKWLL